MPHEKAMVAYGYLFKKMRFYNVGLYKPPQLFFNRTMTNPFYIKPKLTIENMG